MWSHRVTVSAFLLRAAFAYAQTPPSVATILDQAKAQAAANHRAIFVIFHASWCGWCKKLDQFIESGDIKPIIDRYFVKVHFTVEEHGKKKALENAGGEAYMKGLGGTTGGLPYFAFLDEKGSLLVNSIRPGKAGKPAANIGHPGEPEEIDWFMEMVGKAAPQMTRQEAGTLEKWLQNQKK